MLSPEWVSIDLSNVPPYEIVTQLFGFVLLKVESALVEID